MPDKPADTNLVQIPFHTAKRRISLKKVEKTVAILIRDLDSAAYSVQMDDDLSVRATTGYRVTFNHAKRALEKLVVKCKEGQEK